MEISTNEKEIIVIHVLNNQPTANQHLRMIELVYAIEILKLDVNESHYHSDQLFNDCLYEHYLCREAISSPRPLLKGGSPVYFCN